MPEYQYTAADRAGKRVEGKLEAANEGELRMSLRGMGLRPVRISKVSIAKADLGQVVRGAMGGNEKVATERLMNFIRQLQVMLASGVSLVQALDLLYDQESDKVLKKILLITREKINGGSFLWEAFSQFPLTFERVFISLIRAGEASGSLDVMLKRVAKYLENSYRIKRLMKSSMTYPIVVTSVAILVVTLMLVVVIPKLEEMIVNAGGQLPWITRQVMALSHLVRSNFVYIVIVLGIVGWLVRTYVKTKEGRIVFQKSLLTLPLFGPLILKSGVARFCRTMTTLLAAGVSMVDALDICKSASAHISFEDAIGEMKKGVETGSSFATAMAQQKIFPRMATQMTAVGENTGNMDKMLDRVADFYEEEVEITIAEMMKLIEPLMLVVLGGIVGTLMIAMYLPIFQMAGSQV